MKEVMMSCSPRECCNILNYIQSLLVRKKFPKGYKGWVYIYCTKGKEVLLRCFLDNKDIGHKVFQYNIKHQYWLNNACYDDTNKLNGKVVARFYCDKVEEMYPNCLYEQCDDNVDNTSFIYHTENYCGDYLKEKSCLSKQEVLDYLELEQGYAIHISQLEIFDKPKELSEFKRCTEKTCIYGKCHKYMHCFKSLTKAPQKYQWIEVLND